MRWIGTLALCLLMLAGCTGDKERMLQQLEVLEQQNRSGEPMLNDSLAESLVGYFDRHGDANERMRSRYILGRTYYCLGELPRALEIYNEAADCADTISTDCEYKVLSRIHAQSAVILNSQVQPRSQLRELRLAEYYAWKGNDTIQAIECHAQQANCYHYLHISDSVILIKEEASRMFGEIGRNDRAAQTLCSALTSLIEKGDILKARIYCHLYETRSGLFDEDGNIVPGREIYYYSKGCLLLSTHQLDSAELYFRKELQDGKDLNNQIAGCKGLQKVYEQKRIPDSIAKYANLGYILNDSAYSLSEMQNIQKFQASYNYNHQKQLAEQSERKAERQRIIFVCFAIIFMLVGGGMFTLYRSKKQKKLAEYRQNLEALGKIQSELQELCGEDADVPALIVRKNHEISQLQGLISEYQKRQTDKSKASLENRLIEADVVRHLADLLKENSVRQASRDDIRQITNLVNEQIPSFYNALNTPVVLRPVEYEICLLIRCHFKPSAVGKLLNLDEAYVSNTRKRILRKIYGIEGNPKNLDERIMAIV
jgi:tetratricopeptide (TPR) repeat protein